MHKPTFSHTQYDEPFELVPEFGRYSNNRIGLQLFTDYGEPFAKITVNLPDQPAPNDDLFIKDYSENELVVAKMVEMGWLVRTGERVQSGFVSVPIMRLGGELLDYFLFWKNQT